MKFREAYFRYISPDKPLALRKMFIAVGVVFLLAAVTYVDHITGTEAGFSIFYLLPICVVGWHFGAKAGFVVSIIGAAAWHLMDSVIGNRVYLNPIAPYWNALVRFSFFLIVNSLLVRIKISLDNIRARTQELTLAYTELDRVRKEQLMVKDRILSHVSHELRTPLNVIYQFVTLLTDGMAGELRPEQKKYLNIALRNAHQLNSMIGDLLDSTRTESGKLHFQPESVSLKPVVTDVLRTFLVQSAKKKIILTDEIPEVFQDFFVDQVRLRQILTNLVDNAIKFIQEGGVVTIRAAVSDENPDFGKISVIDNGPGIAPQAQKEIFRRLYQVGKESAVSRKGLGLGLYICREIVAYHNGRIWVESQPGLGSAFHFTLPLFSPEKHARHAPAKEPI
ncbi:sensor histidine kinase [Elusimicrobiota bacterium]